MPAREPVQTNDAPAASGAYSQAIRSGGFLFLSGQGPFDRDGNVVDESFAAQARQVFSNLDAVARAAGSSLAQAVRVCVYLSDLKYFAEMNEIYSEYLGDPRPARSTIQSDLRGHTSVPPFDIEADAIVALDG
jgi:2-iminobutanoate/2-iminopropanoate deaminase